MVDEAFGRLRQGLRTRGRDEMTIYVVFGDHGEAFREHDGNIAHALGSSGWKVEIHPG